MTRADGQHDTRYLTPRSHGRNVLQHPVLVGREEEVHRIGSMHARLLAYAHLHLEADVGHAQRYQPCGHLPLHFAGGTGARFGQDLCLRGDLAEEFLHLRFKAGDVFVGRRDGRKLQSIAFLQGKQCFDRINTMLLLERINEIECEMSFSSI